VGEESGLRGSREKGYRKEKADGVVRWKELIVKELVKSERAKSDRASECRQQSQARAGPLSLQLLLSTPGPLLLYRLDILREQCEQCTAATGSAMTSFYGSSTTDGIFAAWIRVWSATDRATPFAPARGLAPHGPPRYGTTTTPSSGTTTPTRSRAGTPHVGLQQNAPAGAVYKTTVLQHSHAATQDPTFTKVQIITPMASKNLISPIIRLGITIGQRIQVWISV